MEKIVVIGSSGAGKSTFARELGAIRDIEVVHLDRYFWQSGWTVYPRTERISIQQQLMQKKKRWIMEGSYIGSSDGRLDAADTIIFLDTPSLLCAWRVIKRHAAKHRQHERPDLPEGCADRLSLTSLLKILFFPMCGKAQLRRKIGAREQRSARKICVLHSNSDVELFLRELSNKRSKGYTPVEQERVQEHPVFALS